MPPIFLSVKEYVPVIIDILSTNSSLIFYIFACYSRCLPDYVENLISESAPFGDLTTYELLCGTDNTTTISPIKFTALSNKNKTGNCPSLFNRTWKYQSSKRWEFCDPLEFPISFSKVFLNLSYTARKTKLIFQLKDDWNPRFFSYLTCCFLLVKLTTVLMVTRCRPWRWRTREVSSLSPHPSSPNCPRRPFSAAVRGRGRWDPVCYVTCIVLIKSGINGELDDIFTCLD